MFKAKLLAIFWISLFVGLISAQSKANLSELCSLASGSTILQPNSCTDWLRCPSSPEEDMEKGSCVVGLYFNKNTGKCEYKENVSCPFEKRCTPKTNGTFFVDNENCNAYFYCNGDEEKRGVCPNDLVFDANKKQCVYRSDDSCTAVTKFTKQAICHSLRDAEFFADTADCTRYSQCQQGVAKTFSCNSTSAWHYIRRTCVPIDEVLCHPNAKKPEPELKVCIDRMGAVSDNVTCSGYYFCRKVNNGTYDRKPQHYRCPAGTFFDSESLSCRKRVNVKCNFDRCEGIGNGYVSVTGNCKAYVLCANGVASKPGVCPNDTYFDEGAQICVSHNVTYAACAA